MRSSKTMQRSVEVKAVEGDITQEVTKKFDKLSRDLAEMLSGKDKETNDKKTITIDV